jgi:hypothetical protein
MMRILYKLAFLVRTNWVTGSQRVLHMGHVKNFGESNVPAKPADLQINTGRFIMFSVITNIRNKKLKGPTLMELFTATGKLNKFSL